MRPSTVSIGEAEAARASVDRVSLYAPVSFQELKLDVREMYPDW